MHYKISVFLLLCVVLAACQRDQIPAQQMRESLQRNVFAFNQAMNSRDRAAVEQFMAPGSEAAFETIISGLREGRYNTVRTTELPNIDYIKRTARVEVKMLQHEDRAVRLVETQEHIWHYDKGLWLWKGPVR
jgi:hypothetical protein